MDISVIVPVFNGGEKIKRCIAALKSQKTARSYEIIVVDDGSTDGSLDCLEDQRVRVLRQPNQGPAAARNLGVKEAQGAIVLFTDGDCEPTESWIEEMVRPMAENPKLAGVKGAYLTRQKRLVGRFVQLEYERKYERMAKDRYIDFIDTYAAGFRKREFLDAGQFDTRFPTASVEDQEFSFRMWEKGHRMIFNPEAKVYHTHSDSVWNYMKKKYKIGYWKALVLKRHPRKIVRDSHTPQSLKLEMIFAVLAAACLLLAPLGGAFLGCAVAAALGFVAASVPFTADLFKKDFGVALIAPLLLLVRAVSLSTGLVAGTIKFHVLAKGAGRGASYAPKRRSA